MFMINLSVSSHSECSFKVFNIVNKKVHMYMICIDRYDLNIVYLFLGICSLKISFIFKFFNYSVNV